MCRHPAHQVNVSRKGVLCAPDYSKFFETPCINVEQNRTQWTTLSYPSITLESLQLNFVFSQRILNFCTYLLLFPKLTPKCILSNECFETTRCTNQKELTNQPNFSPSKCQPAKHQPFSPAG